MSLLNANIEPFEVLVRASRFHGSNEYNNIYYKCIVYAIQSVAGKILTFHVLTDFGMNRSRVPISDIFWKEPTEELKFDFLQLWDCFSENVSVTEFDFLSEKRVQVILKDKRVVWGSHTSVVVDWYRNGYSDMPNQYKNGHLIALDSGHYCLMPNNRLFFKDMNFVTKNFPCELSLFKVDEDLPSVEGESDKWVSGDSREFYYDINETR